MRIYFLFLFYVLFFLFSISTHASGEMCRDIFFLLNDIKKEQITEIDNIHEHTTSTKIRRTLEAQYRNKIREYFHLKGVEFKTIRIKDYYAYLILPSTKSQLNLFALEVSNKYQAQVIFSWKDILRSNFLAFVDIVHVRRGGYRLYFGLSVDSLFVNNYKQLFKDPIIQHELLHIEMYYHEQNKDFSPYYGEIISLKGRIKDDLDVITEAYSKYLSFDEMATFRAQAEAQLGLLKNAKTEKDVKALKEELDYSLFTLHMVAARVQFSIENALKSISQHTANINFIAEGNIVYAEILQKYYKTYQWKIRVPIVRSKGVDDFNNYVLLFAQLDSTLSAAKSIEYHAAKATVIFAKIKSNDLKEIQGRLEQLIQILEELHKNIPE